MSRIGKPIETESSGCQGMGGGGGVGGLMGRLGLLVGGFLVQ